MIAAYLIVGALIFLALYVVWLATNIHAPATVYHDRRMSNERRAKAIALADKEMNKQWN